ncbi:MAG: ribosome maturation factor RimP [Candidatus Zixiibacteriota bacterium]
MLLKKKIEDLITPVVTEEGFELVDLKLARYKRSSRLQLYVDSDHGVSIDDCARISRAIEPVLDNSNVFTYSYTIEVSSPGLDRPLTTARDFKRRIGEKVMVYFNDPGLTPQEGQLVSADDSQIELQKDEERSRFDLANIRMGKIIF